jgi:hypothetical protein
MSFGYCYLSEVIVSMELTHQLFSSICLSLANVFEIEVPFYFNCQLCFYVYSLSCYILIGMGR